MILGEPGSFVDALKAEIGGSGMEVAVTSAADLEVALRKGLPDAMVLDRTGRSGSCDEALERRLLEDANMTSVWLLTASTSEWEEGRPSGSSRLRHIVVAPRRDRVPSVGSVAEA